MYSRRDKATTTALPIRSESNRWNVILRNIFFMIPFPAQPDCLTPSCLYIMYSIPLRPHAYFDVLDLVAPKTGDSTRPNQIYDWKVECRVHHIHFLENKILANPMVDVPWNVESIGSIRTPMYASLFQVLSHSSDGKIRLKFSAATHRLLF